MARARRGFTLIELMVSMVILIVVIYIALAGFNYILVIAKTTRSRTEIRENLSIVLDQMTKELRETYTPKVDDGVGGAGRYGIRSPSTSADAGPKSRSVVEILTVASQPPLDSGESYVFRDWVSPFWDDRTSNKWSFAPILQFYTYDTAGTKHRITYTLGLPSSGVTPQQYWADSHYEPCVLWYSNESWSGAAWSGLVNQPLTEQVITNFTVTRADYSDKIVQVVIEAIQKDSSGRTSPVRLVASVATRQ